MKSKLVACLLLIATQAPASGAILQYQATLNGAVEAPPNASPATGTALVDYDSALETLRVRASFTGLTGTTTAAHIHGATVVPFTGTAGVITRTPSFIGFPLGVTSGSMDQTYDLTLASSFNAAFITAQGSVANARLALLSSIAAGTSYFNIHTSTFGGGEIRGFLRPVPEPGSMALVVALVAGALPAARRRFSA